MDETYHDAKSLYISYQQMNLASHNPRAKTRAVFAMIRCYRSWKDHQETSST